MTTPILEARGIVKSFGHVRSLQGADISVLPGEVVALIGDNGAGKSTLVKILSGVLPADAGEILVDGKPVTIQSPLDARRYGLETVYQDLSLALDLNPIENLFLGREIPARGLLGKLGFLDRRTMRREGAEAFRELGVRLPDYTAPVATFSGGQRQGVAVARAFKWGRRLVFMDEPTAALGVEQRRNVLDLIRRMREAGISIVLISHSMPDVLEVSDRIVVLRHGRCVAVFNAAEAVSDQLIAAMMGVQELEAARRGASLS